MRRFSVAPALLAAAALVGAVAALDVVRWQRPLGAPMRVAAYGWYFTPQWTDLELAFADAQARRAELACALRDGPGLPHPRIDSPGGAVLPGCRRCQVLRAQPAFRA